MKPIILLALAASYCLGQTTATDTLVTGNVYSPDLPRYLVQWQTIEPCYECGLYAVICSEPGCNVPPKSIDRYQFFTDKVAAIKFVNDGFVLPQSCTPDGKLCTAPVEYGFPSRKPMPTKFIAIYEIKAVPLKVTTKDVETPQPATHREVTHVEEK